MSLSEHAMEEGGEVVTLTLRSENPEALRRVLATLDLDRALDVDSGKTEAAGRRSQVRCLERSPEAQLRTRF